jgi:glycosyltransferase involved in cell wall biosynthesis
MRLGVNARRLAGQRLGVGRYIEYLAKYWDRMLERDDRVTLYLREPLGNGGLGLSATFSTRLLRPRLTGLAWESAVLPRHSSSIDVLFCPSYTAPLRYRGRFVLAVHSANEVESGTHAWWYPLTYGRIYRLSAQRADRVIVPSRSVRDDLVRHYGIPEEKIDLVPQGAPDSFRPLDDETLLHETRARYVGAGRPYILWVGKLSQRRNIPLLLRAFAALKKREGIPHALLLVGPNHLGLPLAKLTGELGIADSVVQTDGRVARHEELVPLYNAADLYVNPSAYEGFSLTLVEAMACGIPIVAANRAAVGEIANGAAVMVDELSVESLAEAMGRGLADAGLRREIGEKARLRARSFRLEETARQTLRVLRRVAEGGAG